MTLKIILCDDEPSLTNQYQKFIDNFFKNRTDDYELFVMNKGNDVLQFIKTEKLQDGLFFLDIDLHDDELNGIKLATKIRALNPSAEIAFVSTHEEMLVETIQQRINTLNFIFKDDGIEKVEQQMQATIESSLQYFNALDDNQYFEYVEGNVKKRLAESEIVFFETSDQKGKIIIHTTDGLIYINGQIKDIELQLPSFYRSHKSFLVNLDNVEQFDYQDRQLYFNNGDKCEVAFRKLHEIKLKLRG